MVTQPLRHYDQQERQTYGSRHWDRIRPTLVRAIAREEARDFDDEYLLMLIHEGSNKNENRVLRGQPWISLLFASYSGTLWWYPDKSRIDEVHAYSLQLEGARLPQRDFVEFSIQFGEWITPLF